MNSTEHRAATDQIFNAARRHHVAPGTFCLPADDAHDYASRGARMLIVGADALFLSHAASATWAQVSTAKTTLSDAAATANAD